MLYLSYITSCLSIVSLALRSCRATLSNSLVFYVFIIQFYFLIIVLYQTATDVCFKLDVSEMTKKGMV